MGRNILVGIGLLLLLALTLALLWHPHVERGQPAPKAGEGALPN